LELLFDLETGYWREEIQDEYEASGCDLLIIDCVEIRPKWRGLGVGPAAVVGETILFSQTSEKNGGDDGTRTRGLCRDRLAVFVFSATYILSGAAKSLQGITRTRMLWVNLWVEVAST
jgi:hypothetical protein